MPVACILPETSRMKPPVRNPDDYVGDGYEFSSRIGYGRRVFVHVTRAALNALRHRSDPKASELSLIAEHRDAICALVARRRSEEHSDRIVVTDQDVDSILGPCA